jgi:hypothetical protein
LKALGRSVKLQLIVTYDTDLTCVIVGRL